MLRSTKILSLLLVGVLVAMLLFVATYKLINIRDRLSEVLDRAMQNLWAGDYSILETAIDDSYVDVAAIWKVALDHPMGDNCSAGRYLRASDAADYDYFTSRLKARIRMTESTKGYKLFRAEVTTESESMCSDQSCSVYVLCDKKNDVVYVQISKT